MQDVVDYATFNRLSTVGHSGSIILVDAAPRNERHAPLRDDGHLTEILGFGPAGEHNRAPILALAAGVAFLAGATDVYGLAELHDLYVSFMSGNTTMLGVALGSGHPARAATIAVLVGLFVTGAACGTVLTNVSGRSHTPAVISAVSFIICVPLLEPAWTVYAFILAMGSLNAAISKVGAANVSLTFVTGAERWSGSAKALETGSPAGAPICRGWSKRQCGEVY